MLKIYFLCSLDVHYRLTILFPLLVVFGDLIWYQMRSPSPSPAVPQARPKSVAPAPSGAPSSYGSSMPRWARLLHEGISGLFYICLRARSVLITQRLYWFASHLLRYHHALFVNSCGLCMQSVFPKWIYSTREHPPYFEVIRAYWRGTSICFSMKSFCFTF